MNLIKVTDPCLQEVEREKKPFPFSIPVKLFLLIGWWKPFTIILLFQLNLIWFVKESKFLFEVVSDKISGLRCGKPIYGFKATEYLDTLVMGLRDSFN